MSNDVKKKLDDLKQQMMADPIQLDTNDLMIDPSIMPDPTDVKYIDYDETRENMKSFSEQVITNIIKTYIKEVKLLDSPRLKDLKQKDIMKYSKLLLMEQITETNLIRLQENIDGGDITKEMFDNVDKAQKALREILSDIDKHLDKCEKYWENYAELYGLENEEEKIVSETTDKQDTSDNRVIIDMSQLTANIQNIMEEKNKKDKENKKE